MDGRIKLAAQTIYQALIDAELTHVIGAGPCGLAVGVALFALAALAERLACPWTREEARS